MELDRNALDRWITDSRCREEPLIVTCSACKEETPVKQISEYGVTDWEPCECRVCRREFGGDEDWREDEPPEPDYPPEESWAER